MWARVKGRTENALRRLPFKAVYLFRPGVIQPLHGARSKTRVYAVHVRDAGWLLPPLRAMFPRRDPDDRIGRPGDAGRGPARRAASRARARRYLRRGARRDRLPAAVTSPGRSLSQTMLMMRHCPFSWTSVKKLTPRPRRVSFERLPRELVDAREARDVTEHDRLLRDLHFREASARRRAAADVLDVSIEREHAHERRAVRIDARAHQPRFRMIEARTASQSRCAGAADTTRYSACVISRKSILSVNCNCSKGQPDRHDSTDMHSRERRLTVGGSRRVYCAAHNWCRN